MKRPVEISPNPLLSSTVEIRFVSKFDEKDILGIFYPHFSQIFPSIKEGRIPKEARINDEQLKYSPDFILSNKDFSLSISNNALAFENVGEYKLWPKYFQFICDQLRVIDKIGIIDKIQRLGVRYTSIFEGEFSLEGVLLNAPKMNIEGYDEDVKYFRSEFKSTKNSDYSIKLQVVKNAKASKGDVYKLGTLIDIDSSHSTGLNKLDDNVFKIIDELHTQEKELFFSLLNPQFLVSLNPKY